MYLDSANDAASQLYSSYSENRDAESIKTFGRRLTRLIQDSRGWANDRAALDVSSELRELVPSAKVSIDLAPLPIDEEVAGYIADAVKFASDLAEQNTEDPAYAFRKTAFRAHTIIESETIRSYQRAKLVAYESLASLNDDPTRGYTVHRGLDPAEKQTDAVLVLCSRWCSINDARTCERCASSDGEISPLFPRLFSLDGPPAHARCRCFTHLWGLGWLWEDETVSEEPDDYDEHYDDESRCAHVHSKRLYSRGTDSMADETREPDKSSMLRAYTPKEARGSKINEAERTVEVVASTEAWDSYDTRLMTSGWDLQRYNNNAVVLACHDTRNLEAIIGTAEARVEEGALLAKLRFLPYGVNGKADLAFDLYRAGVLKGVSVGFIPHEYHEDEIPEGQSRAGKRGLTFTRQELVEISAVPVPANPEALARAFDQYRNLVQQSSSTQPPEAITMPEAITAEVAALPRAIADLLKVETEADAIQAIAQRDLELDQARAALVAAEERANVAEAELKRRDEAETVEVVDALIKAKRLSEDKRDSALALARTAPKAFRDLYPPVSEAPKAHILSRVVKPEPVSARKTQEVTPDPITIRATELIKSGASYPDAWAQAVREFESRNQGV